MLTLQKSDQVTGTCLFHLHLKDNPMTSSYHKFCMDACTLGILQQNVLNGLLIILYYCKVIMD